jgi:hypothetical protein
MLGLIVIIICIAISVFVYKKIAKRCRNIGHGGVRSLLTALIPSFFIFIITMVIGVNNLFPNDKKSNISDVSVPAPLSAKTTNQSAHYYDNFSKDFDELYVQYENSNAMKVYYCFEFGGDQEKNGNAYALMFSEISKTNQMSNDIIESTKQFQQFFLKYNNDMPEVLKKKLFTTKIEIGITCNKLAKLGNHELHNE